jgi:DNA-3-methyladenine glycosylase
VLEVARDLIGCRLLHETPEGRIGGRIVEVEAYRGRHDPASHAFRGPTPRSRIMFGPPGRVYVYLSYGMHHCMNIVTEPDGDAAAVLLRALEPTDGIESIRRRRPGVAVSRLLAGPGCLTRGLGVDLSRNGADLADGSLWIEARSSALPAAAIATGPRIGISRAARRPWRFFLARHPSISARPARPAPGPGMAGARVLR